MKEEYSGKFKKIWKSSVFMSFSIVKAKKNAMNNLVFLF